MNNNLNNYISYYHENDNKKENNIKTKKKYKKKHKMIEKTNGLCKNCKCLENVTHFLIECEQFKNERKHLFNKLRNIDIKFKYKNRINVIEMIFPHTWQIQFNKSDKNWKGKNEKNL